MYVYIVLSGIILVPFGGTQYGINLLVAVSRLMVEEIQAFGFPGVCKINCITENAVAPVALVDGLFSRILAVKYHDVSVLKEIVVFVCKVVILCSELNVGSINDFFPVFLKRI